MTQISAANPTVLATADDIVKAVQQRLLVNTLTGNLNVKALAADPAVQASFVPLVEAAELASGPAWDAVNPPLVPVTKVSCFPSVCHVALSKAVHLQLDLLS